MLYSPRKQATCIYRLDLSTKAWINTGTIVDTRATARADVLWDTQAKLYLGTSGVRTIQIGNDKQLPFALYADDIQARI